MNFLKALLVVCIVSTGCLFMPSKTMNRYELQDNFFYAIEQENVKELKLYLAENPKMINEIKKYDWGEGNMPLHYAVMNANYEATKFLLENGADIHGKNIDGDTPFLCAIKYMRSYKNKGRINVRNSGLDIKILQLLIDYGADVNSKSKCGDTALLSLFIKAEVNKNIMIFLLKNKADPNPPNDISVLHYLAMRNYYDVDSFYFPRDCSNNELINLCLDFKANPNCQNEHWGTPLFQAIKNSKKSVIKLLLSRGADKNIQCFGKSMFNVARKELGLEFAHCLLSCGVKKGFSDFVNYKDCSLNYLNTSC